MQTQLDNANDKNPKFDNGWTPLHHAAMKGSTDILQSIMIRIEDKNPKDKLGDTPLHFAATEGHAEIGESNF